MITSNLAKQKTFIYVYIYIYTHTLQKIDFILNFYRTLSLRFLSIYQSSFYEHTHIPFPFHGGTATYIHTLNLCNRRQSERLSACKPLIYIKTTHLLPIIHKTTCQVIEGKANIKGYFSSVQLLSPV